MNILLVDDEPSYRFLVKNALEEEHWTIFEAVNGEEAIHILHDTKIDMIVSDVYMPVMDGIKFHKNVRMIKGYEETPFLFVSAYDDTYTKETVQNARTEGFARKGKPISYLKEWIRYLTTPFDKRPPTPPSDESKIKLDRYSRGDRKKGGTQTPTL